MKALQLVLGVLARLTIAFPAESGILHKDGHVLDHNWLKEHDFHPNTQISVRIALKQRNLENGMAYLLDVSDPASVNYGKHYSAEEVIHLFSPSDESTEEVRKWLVSSGVSSRSITSSTSKGWIDFRTSVGHVESLLDTKYHVFAHKNGVKRQVMTANYTLPAHLHQHIDFIIPGSIHAISPSSLNVKKPTRRVAKKGGGLSSGMIQQLVSNPESTQYCSQYATPKCIKAMYNIPDGKSSNPNNRLGIFGVDNDFFVQDALTKFYALFAPEIPATFGPKVNLIDYGTAKPAGGEYSSDESQLDLEAALPIIYPQGIELYQTKTNFKNGTFGFFNQFLDAIDGAYCETTSGGETGDDPVIDGPTPNEACGTLKPTNVISLSFGWVESDYPDYYLQRQCDEYMKLGLQGTTIVFSSGDAGVAASQGDCLGKKNDVFKPGFPASCPYVTTVGGTVLPSGNAPGTPEITWAGSGGGFSNMWTTPVYQQAAVTSYFRTYDPGYPSYTTSGGKIPTSNGVYNRAGRAFPDISALADNSVIVYDWGVGFGAGTSLSAPIVAAIFTRINEELIAAGKPTIGFANPALYANPGMLNDVTVGSQDNDYGVGQCGGKSFSAVPGWDPATGLGTPNYPAMLKYFLSAGDKPPGLNSSSTAQAQ
ncbi:hypothetical protein NHJ13734_005334 [Beauveria thailandica]